MSQDDDLVAGWRTPAKLQLRTPLAYLKRDGSTYGAVAGLLGL
jgi:hypothetical protein